MFIYLANVVKNTINKQALNIYKYNKNMRLLTGYAEVDVLFTRLHLWESTP